MGNSSWLRTELRLQGHELLSISTPKLCPRNKKKKRLTKFMGLSIHIPENLEAQGLGFKV